MIDSFEGEGLDPLHVRARAERKRRHLTQEQTAKAAGMGLRAYQDFEAGKTQPQPANLRGILRALEMDGEDEARRAETVESWPEPIEQFLDMMGAFLANMDAPSRKKWIQDETRRIMAERRTGLDQ